MERMTIVIVALVCVFCISSSQGLTCYQCANIEMKSGFFESFRGKSDASCGMYPTKSNTVECSYNEVCGSISGDLSTMNLFEAKVQIRGCMPSETRDGLGGCVQSDSLSNAVIGRMLSLATSLPSVKFSGTACSCNFDYCTLCDGGIEILGYCIKYWMLSLIVIGVLAAVIFLITCCCCCCGCCSCCGWCRKNRPVVHSPPYQTLTVIHTPGMTPPSNSLSIQSGDITRQPANQGGAYGEAEVGLFVDKERAGYNQSGDTFSPALA